MQPSVSSPSINTPAAKPRHRAGRWMRSWQGRALLLALVGLLAFTVYWYNEHRKITWQETFSPSFWIRRWNGDDLVQAEAAMLRHGNRDRPEIALTFDDGPHSQSRALLLDTLRKYNVRATFFDVGKRMAQNPDLVRRTLAEGHEIGNHSQNHQRLDGLSEQERHREINDADITFYRLTGQHLALFRPPGMRYNEAVLAEVKRLGYFLIGYTTASRDFNPEETPEFIARRTVRRTEAGSILLLHDYPPTVQALPAIIENLHKQGYRFVTVSEMLAHLPEKAQQALSAR